MGGPSVVNAIIALGAGVAGGLLSHFFWVGRESIATAASSDATRSDVRVRRLH